MKMKLIGVIAGLALTAAAHAETSPTSQGKYALRLNGAVAPTDIKLDGLGKTTKNSKIGELQFGHFFADNLEIFGEVSRYTAKGKRNVFDLDSEGSYLALRTKDAKATALYLGTRYYFPTETRFTPYIGAKAGMIHHEAQKITTTLEVPSFISAEDEATLFKAENKFAAGVQAGLDFNITDNISLGAGIEHIVSTKRKGDGYRSGLVRYTPIFASVKYTFDM